MTHARISKLEMAERIRFILSEIARARKRINLARRKSKEATMASEKLRDTCELLIENEEARKDEFEIILTGEWL